MMKEIKRVDVVLVYPMSNKFSSVMIPIVSLGLEYMKETLRQKGFKTEVCNLDYKGLDLKQTHILRHPMKELVIIDKVLDERKRRIEDRQGQWWKDYEAALKLLSPKLIGIGMMTPQYHAAAMAARIAREIIPGVRVVAGGIHCTAMPEEVLSTDLFDAVVISEGENTIVKLADLFVKGEGTLEQIDGICFERDGKAVQTSPAELIQDLDTLCFPVRDCIVPPSSRYPNTKYSATLITSRGCPFECTYCSRPAVWLHRKIRYRSIENVIEELRLLKRNHEICYFSIADDAFNTRKDRVMDFCDKLLSQKLGLKWCCFLRVDRIDEEQARQMRRADIDWVFIAPDSGSQEILDKMKRGIKIEQIRRAVEILKKERINSNCSFIVGHPDETPETLSQTESLIHELSVDRIDIYFMTPFPGSEIYDNLNAADKLTTYDWFRYIILNPSLIRRDYITEDQLITLVLGFYKSVSYYQEKKRFRALHPAFIWEKLKTVRSFSRFKHLAKRFLEQLKEGTYLIRK